LIAFPKKRSQKSQYLSIKLYCKGLVRRKLRQLLIDFLYDRYLCLFKKDQILLLILLAILFERLEYGLVLGTLAKSIPVAKSKPVAPVIREMLDQLQQMFESHQGKFASVD